MQSFQQLSYISVAFTVWKLLILLIARLAPGPGYDTSTTLLPSTNKLVRWDAIYFVEIARRGHIFEQEWAFNGLSSLLAAISHGGRDTTILKGVFLAHISHYFSVILLWSITSSLYDQKSFVPFITACLHVISPAGVFLSAPYSEGPFACLTMFGFWIYVQAQTSKSQMSLGLKCLSLIVSGIVFGCATTIRANGILSGIPFFLDAVQLGFQILKNINQRSTTIRHGLLLVSTTLGGLCIAGGLILPQYFAYQEYCMAGRSHRSWCYNTPPLVYSFVQSHYW